MKKYKDYMDRVELSSEAHDRILQAMKRQEAAGAETPAAEKETAKVTALPWYRRGSFRKLAGVTAALIVLVVGISAVTRNSVGHEKVTQVGWQTGAAATMTEQPGSPAANGTGAGSEETTETATRKSVVPTAVISGETREADTVQPGAVGPTDSIEAIANMTEGSGAVTDDDTALLIDCRDGRGDTFALSEEDAGFLREMLTHYAVSEISVSSGNIKKPSDGLWIRMSGTYYRIESDLLEEQWKKPLNELLARCGVPELK